MSLDCYLAVLFAERKFSQNWKFRFEKEIYPCLMLSLNMDGQNHGSVLVDRRTVGVGVGLLLAGCLTADDESESAGGGNGDDDPAFVQDAEPDGSIRVSDQRGSGGEISIERVEANVDYRIVVEYENGRVESSTIPAGETHSPTIELETTVGTSQTISVSLVSAEGEEIASTEFRYELAPRGPTLTSSAAHELLSDRTGLLGPWPMFVDWNGQPTVESNDAAYQVEFAWIHEHWEDVPIIGDNEAATEEHLAWANAAFLQALYTSQYEVGRTTVRTHQMLGRDSVGDLVLEPSGTVVISGSSAASVNWNNLVDNGEFPEGLRQVADEYDFTYHEPLD